MSLRQLKTEAVMTVTAASALASSLTTFEESLAENLKRKSLEKKKSPASGKKLVTARKSTAPPQHKRSPLKGKTMNAQVKSRVSTSTPITSTKSPRKKIMPRKSPVAGTPGRRKYRPAPELSWRSGNTRREPSFSFPSYHFLGSSEKCVL